MASMFYSALTLVLFLTLSLPGLRFDKSGDSFFGKRQTGVLKGICCIVVAYVHVPAEMANPVQDAIGSFAYVCVMFFFMVSAYGMTLACKSRKNYLRHFWRNRLSSLLVAYYSIRLLQFAYDSLYGNDVEWSSFPFVVDYVWVLLQYCILFYVVKIFQRRFFPSSEQVGDIVICVAVVLWSLAGYFIAYDATMWHYEKIGLVLGIVMANRRDVFVKFSSLHRPPKLAFLLVMSACLGVLYLRFKGVFFLGEYLLKVILGACILSFVLVATAFIDFKSRPSIFLGSISYEVFLIHGLVMSVLLDCHLIGKTFFVPLAILASVAVAVPLNYIHTKIIKRCRFDSV